MDGEGGLIWGYGMGWDGYWERGCGRLDERIGI